MGSSPSCSANLSAKVFDTLNTEVDAMEDPLMLSSRGQNKKVTELLAKWGECIGMMNSEKEEYTAGKRENLRIDICKLVRETTLKAMSCHPKMNEEGEFVYEIRQAVSLTNQTFFALERFSTRYEEVEIISKEVAGILVETKFLDLVCEVIEYTYNNGLHDEDYLKRQTTKRKPFNDGMFILMNFSDASHELAIEIVNKPQILQLLKTIVVDYTDRHLEKVKPKLLEEELKMLDWALTIFHNMSKIDTHVNVLRDVGMIDTLQPLLQSKEERIAIFAIASLSGMINEKECEIIKCNIINVVNLLEYLRKGQNDKTRRYHGWSCKECAFTIKNLTRNDANKKLLVDLGALELLVNLGRNGSLEEQFESVQAIWALCFNEDNQYLITRNADLGVIELLLDLKEADDMMIKRACNGALWTLKDALTNTTVEKYKLIGIQLALKREKSIHNGDGRGHQVPRGNRRQSEAEKSQIDDKPSGGHIMISYQWGDQAVLKDVRDNLKASGCKIWMDIDQMEGSIIQAMAEAVEGADVFLMCMSSKYKNSLPCRTEAEYAYQKKKKIIPLKMEKGYSPDGWLGILLGANIFYEFSGKYPFEKKMGELLKAINSVKASHGSADTGEINLPSLPVVQPKNPISSSPTVGFNRLSVSIETIVAVRKWRSTDVSNWIKANSLSGCGVDNLTGGEIALLASMRFECPEYFYKCLQDMLHVKDLLTMSKIVWALNDLSEHK